VIIVDTTVLAYAVGMSHPLKEPSERLLAAVAAGAVQATTTVEVIQEFAHIRSRRFPRRDAVRVARGYAQLLSPLLAADEDVLERGLAIYERNARIGAFDAILAASALVSDAEVLVSADSAFGSVPRLRHVMPGTPEFERLLTA
jgi:predicted nucleic acid-binding protein